MRKDPSKIYEPGEKIAGSQKHSQVWPTRKDTSMKNIYIRHSVNHEKTNEKEDLKQKLPINMSHG